jgi:hypothetical protein
LEELFLGLLQTLQPRTLFFAQDLRELFLLQVTNTPTLEQPFDQDTMELDGKDLEAIQFMYLLEMLAETPLLHHILDL